MSRYRSKRYKISTHIKNTYVMRNITMISIRAIKYRGGNVKKNTIILLFYTFEHILLCLSKHIICANDKSHVVM